MRPKSSQCASLRPAGYIRYQSFAVVAVRKIRRGRHLGSFPFVAVLETQQSTTPAPVERTKLPVPASHNTDPKQRGLKGTKTEAALKLFPLSHVDKPDLYFYLYLPFGIAIAAVRMLMWLSLLLLDQAYLTDNNLSISVLQALLGVDVQWRNTNRLPQSQHVLVSNHSTTGDMMALYRLPFRTVHLISSKLPRRIAKSQHHRIEFRHASVEAYEQLKVNPGRHPIHLFPEGGMTNGTGMMKFNKGFLIFSSELPVVPVALRAELPWGISTHTLNSSFISNMFWFCFSPYVKLRLDVLPPLALEEGEHKASFVERIQQSIADELQIPIHDFSLQAKKQLMRSKSNA